MAAAVGEGGGQRHCHVTGKHQRRQRQAADSDSANACSTMMPTTRPHSCECSASCDGKRHPRSWPPAAVSCRICPTRRHRAAAGTTGCLTPTPPRHPECMAPMYACVLIVSLWRGPSPNTRTLLRYAPAPLPCRRWVSPPPHCTRCNEAGLLHTYRRTAVVVAHNMVLHQPGGSYLSRRSLNCVAFASGACASAAAERAVCHGAATNVSATVVIGPPGPRLPNAAHAAFTTESSRQGAWSRVNSDNGMEFKAKVQSSCVRESTNVVGCDPGRRWQPRNRAAGGARSRKMS